MKPTIALLFVASCLNSVLPDVSADEPDQKAAAVSEAAKAKAKAKPILFQYKSAGIEVPAAKADELKVAAFGPETILAARKYLDDGANYWVREKNCVACHSTGVYMAERPALTALLGKPSEEVLAQFIKSMPDTVGEPVLRNGAQYYGASIYAVWRSVGLAAWDRHVTGTLSEHTDKALRQTLACLAAEGFIMTSAQVEIPYITTDFELTVQAARAIVTAPGWLDSVTDVDTLERIERMKSFLRKHEPISDYEHAIKLQLASLMPDLVSQSQREASIAMLWRQQLPDGGWSTRRMSDVMKWHVKMDPKVVTMIQSEPDAANPGSDPYMTAFAIVLLREAGIPAADARIQKGIVWLKENQRVSGRWWMKSLYRDTYHYITYISTAQALRALALCGEVPDLTKPVTPPTAQNMPQTPTYQRPAKAVLDVLHAPLPPSPLLSPNCNYLLLGEINRYPGIADLAEPMLRLAGIRISPRTNGTHGAPYLKSLKLRSLDDSKETEVALPAGARIGMPRWNGTSSHVVLTRTSDEGIELWILDAATAIASRIPGIRLNGLLGSSVQWMPDNQTLLVKLVPADRGAPPQPPVTPPGPKVLDSTGSKAASSTYEARDLLRNPHDADLFDYYTRCQLALVNIHSAKVTLLGQPATYTNVEAAPDGKHLLVERLERPYSYLRPYGRFPKTVAIWDTAGTVVETVASIPLADQVPIDGVEPGPRHFGWHPMDPATLIWAEALDGGNPKEKVAHRDKVMMRSLGQQPQELFRTPERLSGLDWLDSGERVMVSDFDRVKHWTRTWIHRRGDAQDKAHLVWDRSLDDRYGHPGSPLNRLLPTNHFVVRLENDSIFLRGNGASPEGDRPFLDRMNIKTLETERLFRCDKEHVESVVDWVSPSEGRFLTRRESPTEFPNYYLRTLEQKPVEKVALGEASLVSSVAPVTNFPDPFPMLKGITKQRFTAHRADGVAVNFTLYLPPNRQAGAKLPTVFWAYPLDYTEAANAGQITGSTNEFTFVGGTSNLFFLLQGYAVMEVSMPVVGPVETAYDTFIEQLEANAKAAIDKADELGVIDRDRIGVGGHSHGALMTATFMAHSDLFRAGIARSGAYNHTLRPFGFQNEKRTLYEAKQTYEKLSPLIQADKIKHPLLLIHGEIDSNPGTVPLQSEKLFEALRGLGATARLVMLPYEDHGYRALESTEHVLYEMINWFDIHVKNAPPRKM